jgi:magnesium-transporting ATPase (P-type)
MITGDAIQTATAIAKEVGILGQMADYRSNAVTGTQFEAMDHEQRMKSVKNMNVFARVEPKHKRDLVKCLIEHGEIVAMTGDGVNDAPALK